MAVLNSAGITMGSVTMTPQGTAPSYAIRAWCNFNGTGAVAIRDSGNVSSITDNGSGDYTVNITTAFSSANYCATASNGIAGGNDETYNSVQFSTAKTTSACQVRTRRGASDGVDNAWVHFAAVGDT